MVIVLLRSELDQEQEYAIDQHIDVGMSFGVRGAHPSNRWRVKYGRDSVTLEGNDRTFDMHHFLECIDVPEEAYAKEDD